MTSERDWRELKENPSKGFIRAIQTKTPHFWSVFVFLLCEAADYLFLPTFRRETMSRFEYFFGFRDFCPFPVGLP